MFSFNQSINEAAFEEFTQAPVTTYELIEFRPLRFKECVGPLGDLHVWVRMTRHTTRAWDADNGWNQTSDWFRPCVYLDGVKPTLKTYADCPLNIAYNEEPALMYLTPTREHLGEFTMKLHAWLDSDAAKAAMEAAALPISSKENA